MATYQPVLYQGELRGFIEVTGESFGPKDHEVRGKLCLLAGPLDFDQPLRFQVGVQSNLRFESWRTSFFRDPVHVFEDVVFRYTPPDVSPPITTG